MTRVRAGKAVRILLVFSSIAFGGCGGGDANPLAAEPPSSAPPPATVPPATVPPPTVQPPTGQTINATPTDYLAKLRALQPGQTLVLAAGTYDDPRDVPGLPIFNLNGSESAPITITGAGDPAQTVLLGRATHNTIRFSNSSYVTVRNLTVDGRNLGGDGVNAQGTSHHVTLENLVIRGVGGDQQIVGISANGATTWNWTIRGCTVTGAGTGMYLGNSDGTNPFIAGLIERNVFRDTIGYNVQIKHQVPWSSTSGPPTARTITIVRHNVFSKGDNSSSGSMARPNLLIGDVPDTGPGAENGYEVYGNFFYRNPTEALFQAEGNVAFYSNLLVNDAGPAIHIQRHNGKVRTIRVFGNTVLATATGIAVTGGDTAYTQQVAGNAVFAATPISAANAAGNVTDSYANAVKYLNNPFGAPGQLDLFPKAGQLRGAAIDTADFSNLADAAVDFNGRARDWTLRGAYSGEGSNPGWMPAIERKP